ncbi:hypothetical protein A3D80_01170 [Candidatus Roizmanbacteria bacterium RIFCSPHIGHO2_02_FULL_40_13b]|uniref:PLD phosphodiesterase domain-containing protein n=1 Tax=Candidatus Roizmanbacteria bacterium RIFCSPHIGHO2_01_FULL_39_24 TaxID=1802032 RepID=A0A1F7GHU5_9BACT|nr:MAG: hypothetical protein A2799_03015 [Candidatus Roizmanbacteria bacterium RIFCSPHIGHO2_01_FULL_39_24]OGK26336.1 MAG: hypothetical protein A3D80_01170 [Candidatus Roizmanbacteria bacterium RIFCSPHIGHO2_02_FULL_40_13b]OGK50149.1 MAG: hypothetical protein A3A56_00515 [Candidatus Roizmanbacteria bacterium RIFCSPLOWO2_01_FULL_40_32]OGK56817.1 MAG: hypothetical protein A3H83_03715 [Candidatus Roizmanbacteria bacterium RIFCSPLOWO2_02_FULL_39_8]
MNKYLYTPYEFITDLIDNIDRAHDTVWIQTMYFETGNHTKLLEKALIRARKRGVEVKIYIDWITEKYANGELDIFPSFSKVRRTSNKNTRHASRMMFELFEKNSIEVIFTNQPNTIQRIVPIVGRNHIKLFLVDQVGWIGGMNLGDKNFESIDLMVKMQNISVVQSLYNQFLKINSLSLSQDHMVTCDFENNLLVDKGLRGQSIIFKKALELTSHAQSNIIYISQFTPDSELLSNIIESAKQGINISIITSYKKDKVYSQFPFNCIYSYFIHKIKSYPNIKLVHKNQHVHAKLLIVDEKEVLFGSHNMTKLSVFLGTQELSLYSRDKELVTELTEYAHSLMV